MKKLILIFLMSLSFSVYAKSELDNSRYLLKNYGMSYCLSNFMNNDEIRNDAGAASNIYFQAGAHHGEAYQKVRYFIKKEFPTVVAGDSENNPLIFYKCLEIFNSKKYQKFIRSLDKYYGYTQIE